MVVPEISEQMQRENAAGAVRRTPQEGVTEAFHLPIGVYVDTKLSFTVAFGGIQGKASLHSTRDDCIRTLYQTKIVQRDVADCPRQDG
jgi:hypothetical protein